MKFDLYVESCLNGLAKGKSLNTIAKKHKTNVSVLKKQLSKGMNVEMEHTKKKSAAKKIAMDHLFEDPEYYTKLAKMEKKR